MAVHPKDPAHAAFDLLDEFDRLDNPNDIMSRMSAVLSQFGYTSFIIATVPEAIGNAQPEYLIDGWPPGWTELYSRKNFYLNDPVVARCRQSVDPFEWREVVYDPETNPRAAQIMHIAEDFKLKKGFVIPIIRDNGLMSGVVMAGERPDFDARAKRAMHLIGLYAHKCAATLLGHEKPIAGARLLSEGEREVLAWTAIGKSSWEISVILDISEAAVVWRVKQAAGKLNAVNRTQAVVNAIKAKEIRL
jgi:LuxR family transcriptional regulator, quorum-sensing system regulator BjaR1